MFGVTSPPAPGFALRPYQLRFVESVLEQLRLCRSTLGVMATGLGKTVCFAEVARRWERGRVLVVAHREELIHQAAEKLAAATGQEPGVEMADSRVDRHSRCRVVVSSVQTLSRPRRLEKFAPDDFGLVVVDEAHHAVAASYLRVLAHFQQNPALRVLGVTATPKRADDVAMGQVFESAAFDYGIEPASEDGWLVEVRQQVVKVDGLDFSACRTLGGDFNEADLEAVVTAEKVLHAVAAPTAREAGGRPTLVFCVTVAHAERMREILDRYRPGSAAFLCGATDKDERRRIVRNFREGRTQFLCNVGVLLEGFDAPACACVAMARPTKSLPLYTQVIGRGTRALPGVIDGLGEAAPAERRAAIRASGKPDLLVLDYAGNAGRHRIVTCADVLGGKFDAAVKAYARKTAEEEGRPALVGEALERAGAELALLEEERERKARKAREEAARRCVVARPDYRTQDVPLYGGGVAARSAAGPRRTPEPASEKQVRYLRYLGVGEETARGYTKRQASAVIDKLAAAEAS